MQTQIKKNPYKKWSQLIGESYFQKQEKDSKKRYFSYSVPVFNKNYKMAIVYVEFNNSGELRVYKKTNRGSWKRYAGALLWSSD